jgi:hypothetical protein
MNRVSFSGDGRTLVYRFRLTPQSMEFNTESRRMISRDRQATRVADVPAISQPLRDGSPAGTRLRRAWGEDLDAYPRSLLRSAVMQGEFTDFRLVPISLGNQFRRNTQIRSPALSLSLKLNCEYRLLCLNSQIGQYFLQELEGIPTNDSPRPAWKLPRTTFGVRVVRNMSATRGQQPFNQQTIGVGYTDLQKMGWRLMFDSVWLSNADDDRPLSIEYASDIGQRVRVKAFDNNGHSLRSCRKITLPNLRLLLYSPLPERFMLCTGMAGILIGGNRAQLPA